jgi:hypothetical protein
MRIKRVKESRSRRRSRLRDGCIQAIAATALSILSLAALAPGAGAVSDETAVTIAGNPLTVYVGPRGECQSSYVVNGEVQGNYFPGGGSFFTFSPVADCGFFLAFPKSGAGQPVSVQGQTYGFAGHAGPGGLSDFKPISQSAVTGDGSAGNPFSQTTVFEVEGVALVTETTTYVNGAPQFTSTYNVKNVTAGKIYFRAMYAGDLYVAGNDHGTGVFLGGPPRFIGGQNTSSGILGGFLEVGPPALAWDSWEELAYPDVWQRIEDTDEEARAFKEGIEANEVDNAAGVEWDQLRSTGLGSGAEQSFSIINRTQVPSALSVVPVNQSHTVGETATVTVTATDNVGTPYANRSLVYSIGGANPKSGSVTTNAAGQATISYVGTAAGIDTMQMFLDLNNNGLGDNAEPKSTAQIIWVPAPPTPNSTYTIKSIKANSDGTITIVFVPAQDGKATLEVTVPTATISRNASIAKRKKCKHNQVRIKGKCRPRTSLSGRVSATGKAGVPLTLTVKASGKVKRALAKGRKVQLTAKLTYKSVLGGAPTVKVFHFTVKKKRKKHH